MKKENPKPDNVYAYIFEAEKVVYVGRTVNIKSRDRSHRHDQVKNSKQKYVYNSPVYTYAQEHHINIPEMLILETGLSRRDGLLKESEWIDYYKNNGYTLLNTYPTGLFCGAESGLYTERYSDENLKELGSKFKSLTEFKVKEPNTYKILKDKNLLDKLQLPLHPVINAVSDIDSSCNDSNGRNFSEQIKRWQELYNLGER